MNKIKFFSWITFCLFLGSFNIALLAGCTAKYVEIEDPSEKLELSCYSIKTPWEAKWYWWNYSVTKCQNRAKFVTGGGEDLYIVDFFSNSGDWRDKYSNEYLWEQGEKFIASEEKRLLKDKERVTEKVIIDQEVVHGVKDICTRFNTEYTFSSSKPIYYKTRGQTGEEIEFSLKPSDKYFLEYIEFSVIEGPYKMLIGRSALVYKVRFIHISVNENRDPELEAKALNFLKNLEVTVDWEKDADQ